MTPARPAAGRLRAVPLFTAGVLAYADSSVVAITALIAVSLILLAIGFSERRARGAVGGGPGRYESIPQTPFVVIGLPIPMGLIAVLTRLNGGRGCARAHLLITIAIRRVWSNSGGSGS